MDKIELFKLFYKHVIKGTNLPKWQGLSALKLPSDFFLYQEVIFKNKPDYIIETGTRFGGSARFFANMCELNGKGQVITIDIRGRHQPPYPNITYIQGSSISNKVVRTVSRMTKGKSVMVVLDSNHSYDHVLKELERYSRIVTKGQYMVVEDCIQGDGDIGRPSRAIDDFMKKSSGFKRVDLTEKYIVGFTSNGWLLKK